MQKFDFIAEKKLVYSENMLIFKIFEREKVWKI